MNLTRMLIVVILFLAGITTGAIFMFMVLNGRFKLPFSLDSLPGISKNINTKKDLNLFAYKPKNFEVVAVNRGRRGNVVTLHFNSVKYPKEIYIIKVADEEPFSWNIIKTASIYQAEISDYISVKFPIEGDVALFYIVVVTEDNILVPFGEVNFKTEGPTKPFKVIIK